MIQDRLKSVIGQAGFPITRRGSGALKMGPEAGDKAKNKMVSNENHEKPEKHASQKDGLENFGPFQEFRTSTRNSALRSQKFHFPFLLLAQMFEALQTRNDASVRGEWRRFMSKTMDYDSSAAEEGGKLCTRRHTRNEQRQSRVAAEALHRVSPHACLPRGYILIAPLTFWTTVS